MENLNVMMNVEVMMVKKEEVDGKMVKVIKMMDMNENVMDYIEVGSSDKVKEMIKDKIRISRVFGGFDVDELWYKWDGFLKEWRKRRLKLIKKRKEEEEAKKALEEMIED